MALDTQAARLQWARRQDGRYKRPTDAARAFGWKVSTYLGHENNDRPIGRKSAIKYGRAYKVRWEWLLEGEGPPRTKGQAIPVEGYVGAGAEFTPFDDSNTGLGNAPLMVEPNSAAVIVRGDSMYPRYFDGEFLYYIKEERPPENFYGKECVVRLSDGRMFVKIIRKGSQKGLFTLESWNAPPLQDQAVEWAAPVTWRRG